MLKVAQLSLSVDLDGGATPQPLKFDGELGRVVSKLQSLATHWDIPLTWAASEPHLVVAARGWLKLPQRHTWALRADRSWAGAGVERFSRELRRRQELAREAGISIVTLALGDLQSREYLDHANKNGIEVLRTAGSPSTRLAGDFPAPSHRLGVLRVPTLARIPAVSHWGWSGAGRGLNRLLQAGINQAATTHWVIDAQRMVGSSATSLRQLDRMFEDAAAARDTHRLRIDTLEGLAVAARPQAIRRQARSILRAA